MSVAYENSFQPNKDFIDKPEKSRNGEVEDVKTRIEKIC